MSRRLKRILINIDRCSGCRLCEMVCSFNSESAFGSSTSKITVIKEDRSGLDLPVVCWHCNPCKPLDNCPVGALERNEEGLVFVKEEKCVGCELCSENCAMGAVKLHPCRNMPLICDQCGGNPVCVEKCPTKALNYVEANRTEQPKLPKQVIEETLHRWGIIA